MDTFEKILTLHGGEQVYDPVQTAMLKRVFESLCVEQEVDTDFESRENMARMVLMASHANRSEKELYELASKVVKRFPQTSPHWG
jgi:hypothetical protein